MNIRAIRCGALLALLLMLTATFGAERGLLREVFFGANGTIPSLTSLPTYPNSPDSSGIIPDFEAPAEIGEQYGQRVRGYIVPPTTGNYVFSISSDDNSELWLSTDQSPARIRQIATVPGWTAAREWTKYPEQQSAPISLIAGRIYYIEALMAEGGGGDNLAVMWQLPNGTIEEPIPSARLVPWGATLGAPQITQQPASVTVVEGGSATFGVTLGNVDAMTYQWFKNGTAISGATSPDLLLEGVPLADNGAKFHVTIANSAGSTNSTQATLTVTRDTTPPTVIGVANLGTNEIRISFSEAVNEATATTLNHYALSGGLTVQSATISRDGRSVILRTSPMVYGTTYTVTVSSITDRASTPNTIAPNSQTSLVARPFIGVDIGGPQPASAVVHHDAGLVLTVGGGGIGSTTDQFGFQYLQLSGDFDYEVRLESLLAADAWTKAGLMARSTLNASSSFFAAVATPSIAGMHWQARATSGGTAVQGGNMRVNYPHNWLRLRRVGNTFTAYGSVNGEQWVTLGSNTLTDATQTMYLGMFVTASKQGAMTRAVFQQFAQGSGSFITTQTFPTEPIGPSSRRTGLVISEIMYNPLGRVDGLDTEFIEIFNSQGVPEDISNFSIAGDVSFTFPPNTILPGGGFIVVAKNPAAISAAYGQVGAPVVGPFTGELSNGSGTVEVRNRIGAVLLQAEYLDEAPFPVAPDGGGHSLVLARPSYGEGHYKAWGASELVGGSPGSVDPYVPSALTSIVINEFLAHTDEPQKDFIELFNTSADPINLSGATLTDSPGTPKFVIPANTILTGRSWISFNQDQLGFSLKSGGERLFLQDAQQTRVLDAVSYSGQANGVSMGRVPDGAPRFASLNGITEGRANAAPIREKVVISEIMFNPISRDDSDEFIELHNRSASTVSLAGWRFISGIDYEFPAEASIPAGGYVTVARNAARLLTNYSGLTVNNTFGNYNGTLANGGERVALAQPDHVTTTNGNTIVTNTIYILVDEVTYGEGGRWGKWADGGGSSLELIDLDSDNDLPSNWSDSDETRKAPWVTVEHTGVLDWGQNAANELHVMLLGGGEALVDNIEVISGGANRVSNGTFEGGATGWVIQGNHVRSSVAQEGFNSARSLQLRASSGGDNGANRVETDLTTTIASQTTATIRAKARWLRGDPFLLLRFYGNWLEASGKLTVPKNLGTPGAANSVAAQNVGPAIYDVIHSPILPAANRPVVVTARVNDPDGFSQVQLRWKLDAATTFNTVAMNDAGQSGDAIANDGLFSGTIPGQANGATVLFFVQSSDNLGMTGTFPVDPVNREAVVRFGEQIPSGHLPTYRLMMSAVNTTRWNSREKLSNEPVDATFVYNDYRVIYNSSGRYRGSPWIRPSYGSPTSALAYVFNLPEDDTFLNETELNLDGLEQPSRDNTLQRERMSFWIADKLDIPFSHQRYIHLFVNGSKRGLVFTDSQQPNGDYIESWFAGQDDGEIYKIDDWFEFNDSVSKDFNVDATLEDFTTTSGAKMQARYRWNWERKSLRGIDDDYSTLFQLVDALNNPTPSNRAEDIMDADEVMRAFAVRHIVGDWDGYGYNRGKNTFSYKPDEGTWKILLWDLDFSLGGGSDGPTTSMFNFIGHDTGLQYIYNNPVFLRAYYRAMQDAVNGPLLASNFDAAVDANYTVFQNNGLSTISSPSAIKSWVQQRRTHLINTLNQVAANFAITSNNGNNFSTNKNTVTLNGAAPIGVKTIEVNGIAYPINWTGVTQWQITIPVSRASNSLLLQGYDIRGQAIASARDTITVNYTGTITDPAGTVVINEIMPDPAVAGTAFVELHNTSTSFTFDLSNWQLDGVDFVFPEGTTLAPNSYLVVAADRLAFAARYGNTPRVAGEFAGALQNDGETLRLIAPSTTTPAQNIVVDVVRYATTLPWPAVVSGTGGSLQLMDPSKDNFTVANWAAVSGVATPGAHNSVRATLAAFPTIWINEVQPENTTGASDNAGEREPWIELYNSGTAAISLQGLYLSSSASNNLQQFALPNISLGAGQYLVIWADGETSESTASAPHANFRLNAGAGSVALTYLQGATPKVLDYVEYRFISPNRSYGSLPDGPGIRRQVFHFTTPGAANNPASAPVQVFLNEWMASNNRTITDPADNQFEDWFELFNGANETVDLSGFYLTDDLTNQTKFRIPDGVVIPANGHLLVWADEEPTQFRRVNNDLHVSFKLGQSGESLGLFSPEGNAIDQVTFGVQTNDVSHGRSADGAPAPFVFMSVPTPGARNAVDGNRPPVITAIGDRFATEGQTIRFQIVARDFDTPAQTLTYTMSGAPAGATLSASGEFVWTPSSSQVPATNRVTITVTDNGSPAESASATFNLIADRVNNAPSIAALGNRSVAEGAEISFQVTATDPDTALGQALRFSLGANSPTGAIIDATTGTFRWTPHEAQGPSANAIAIIVTDDGRPSLSATSIVNIAVSEVNAAPVITAPGDQVITQGDTVSLKVTATDVDAPANTLSFSFEGTVPSGMTINPSTGVISWTTTPSHVGTNTVTIRVTDNGTPALSATTTARFIVTQGGWKFVSVTGTASSSVLYVYLETAGTVHLDDMRIVAGSTPAVGANRLANGDFEEPLSVGWNVSANHSGSSIDTSVKRTGNSSLKLVASTGGTTQSSSIWQSIAPALTSGATYTLSYWYRPTTNAQPLIVRLSGNGIRSEHSTVVTPNAAPTLAAISNKTVAEGQELSFNVTATDPDLPSDILTFTLDNAPAGAAIDPGTGAFSWTPTEAQGPGNYPVTIRVRDSGSPALSASQNFTITVSELNQTPALQAIPAITIDAGQTATFTAKATDADLPAQSITYSLVNAPAGASINAQTGAFSWSIPANAPGGAVSFEVRATDNGSPALASSTGVTINVRAQQPANIRLTSAFNSATGQLTLTWNSQANVRYRLESRDSLNSGSWVAGQEITATGPSTSVTIDTRAKARAFHRVTIIQ